ncbi:hypothetical protein HanRHA438_Chr02g0088101 [Helianthus annuus]|nr:hypothetical protein HanRHA438_Chr02g0088101 [Helianthus annuus]
MVVCTVVLKGPLFTKSSPSDFLREPTPLNNRQNSHRHELHRHPSSRSERFTRRIS